MGLLDEAIRDHLELKRRRGADPAEIARLEREALGPVRRGPQATDVTPEPVEADIGLEEEIPGDWEEEYEGGFDEVVADSGPSPDLEPVDPIAGIEPGQLAQVEEPLIEPQEPTSASIPPPAVPPPGPEPEPGGETIAYDPEAEADAELADADMLEETPEFLQDTPDHDRLWFEQRPPKDFDFDG